MMRGRTHAHAHGPGCGEGSMEGVEGVRRGGWGCAGVRRVEMHTRAASTARRAWVRGHVCRRTVMAHGGAPSLEPCFQLFEFACLLARSAVRLVRTRDARTVLVRPCALPRWLSTPQGAFVRVLIHVIRARKIRPWASRAPAPARTDGRTRGCVVCGGEVRPISSAGRRTRAAGGAARAY